MKKIILQNQTTKIPLSGLFYHPTGLITPRTQNMRLMLGLDAKLSEQLQTTPQHLDHMSKIALKHNGWLLLLVLKIQFELQRIRMVTFFLQKLIVSFCNFSHMLLVLFCFPIYLFMFYIFLKHITSVTSTEGLSDFSARTESLPNIRLKLCLIAHN